MSVNGVGSPLAVSPFILNHIRRGNRNRLIGAGAVLLIVCYFLFEYRNFFLEPVISAKVLTQADLVLAKSDSGKFRDEYVRVEGAKVFDTGFKNVLKKKSRSGSVSETISDDYLVLQLDGRALVIKADHADAHEPRFNGHLEVLPIEIKDSIAAPMKEQGADVDAILYPFMLSESKASYGRLVIAGLLALVGAVCALILHSVWLTWQDAAQGDTALSLAKYGDLRTVCADIESQKMNRPVPVAPDVQILGTWLVREHVFGLDVLRSDKVAWVYMKITKHSKNFIPTGTTHEFVVLGYHGENLEFILKKAEIEPVLAQLQAFAPWAIFGYSADLAKLWSADQAGFVAAVEERRQTGTT